MYYTFVTPGFTKADLPKHLCRTVVLCCLNSTSQAAVDLAVRQGLELKRHLKRVVSYIAVGGPWQDTVEINGWFQSNETMTHHLEIIVATIWQGTYTGGAAI
ncbi:unnamed protein product [Ixodes hexagonus]